MMRNQHCFKQQLAPLEEPTEEEQDNLMRTIDQVALALVKAHPEDADSLSGSMYASKDCRRLRVPQPNLEDAEDNYVTDGVDQGEDANIDETVTDMCPSTLPATQKRAKDEVDVAAAGIPLEVRRLQCTKSTLALKEATKNDLTPQSSKLLHYMVSLTYKDGQMCTEREMCQWLVAQMCDRMETGQIWIVAKTYALLSVLLWRGSNSFVQAVHEYGAAMFQAAHVSSLLQTTAQENLSGERLPCSLQPIDAAAAGQKSAGGKAKTPSAPCLLGKLKLKNCGQAKHADPHGVPTGDLTFFVSNIAYLESLCEYRVRHPTLDLAHGEILTMDLADSAAAADPVKAAAIKKMHSPAAWKEVLDDTLELMKAIAVTDPHAPLCGLGVAAATSRVRESVLLYQVACRALVRLLHSVLTVSHTFVASIQAGLQVPSSNLSPDGTPITVLPKTTTTNLLGVSFDPNALDYSLSPDIVHGYSRSYYSALYQFNRTVNMLKAYCESAEHVDKETLTRARAAFKTLPESSILEVKESLRKYEHPICSVTIRRLYEAALRSHEQMGVDGFTDNSASFPSSLGPSSPATSSQASAQPPLSDEEVRRSMLAVQEFHAANLEEKQLMWKHRVETLCNLFDEKESRMLQQIFMAGMEGLQNQWKEFTNNGAAAAEKALMTSVHSTSFASKRTGSNMPGLSSDGGVSGDRTPGRNSAATDSLTKSSTYILRSLPFGVRARRSVDAKADVITLDRSSSQSVTESSIDALLREDDVVVICNEECSCNDTLKLVDRFQVLLDVPLGEGSYGKVYRAWDEVIGCYLAAKELPLDASKAHNVAVREVLQEYTVLTELSHPNIVRVVAFMVLKQTARIYMEWMPSGSLQDVLRHHPRGMLRESVVRRYARDVLSGLAFLHSRGVIHRDVKPGNMLLSSDGAVKLTDFGTSLVLSGNSRTLESNAVTGTAAYMAPESVQGIYSSASDIWSFGCSVVQLVSGNVPWFNPATGNMPEPIALLFKIGSLDDTTHLERPHDVLKASSADAGEEEEGLDGSLSSVSSPAVSEGVPDRAAPREAASAELLAMLDAIFVVDRKKRPSASELMQHPFFKVL